MSEYPLANGFYYGVNYGERGRKGIPQGEIPCQFVPPHCGRRQASGARHQATDFSSRFALRASHLDYSPNDLSFYANIPTPCSYMCMGSKEDFFGGYDYAAQAGIIHIANHHVAPGKKQWTWGNHEFGYAWDRNLTERDENGEYAPYIELMAGVFTDNQPDFSFLQPGETKAWSQYWYPIQKIGPAQHANLDAAVSLQLDKRHFRIGVSVTRRFQNAIIRLESGVSGAKWNADLAPGKPFIIESVQPRKPWKFDGTILRVCDRHGNTIISYFPKRRSESKVPPPATEPPVPRKVASNDELFLAGLHLEQYRHATRCPTLYWREALRRDPLDSRCNNALGLWLLRRGELADAEKHFRKAIERLTLRNANPYDGEAFYNLGRCLRFLVDQETGARTRVRSRSGITPDLSLPTSHLDEAYSLFYKATWNQAWARAAYHALAEMDCCRNDWAIALDHLDRSLRLDADNPELGISKSWSFEDCSAARRRTPW